MSNEDNNPLLKEYKIIQDSFDTIKNQILNKHLHLFSKKKELIEDLFSIFDFQLLFINQISQTFRGINEKLQCKEKIIFNLVQINQDICMKRINSFISKYLSPKTTTNTSLISIPINPNSSVKAKINHRNSTPKSTALNLSSQRVSKLTRNRNQHNLNLKSTLTNEDIIEKIKRNVEKKNNQNKYKNNPINSDYDNLTFGENKPTVHRFNKSNSTLILNKQQQNKVLNKTCGNTTKNSRNYITGNTNCNNSFIANKTNNNNNSNNNSNTNDSTSFSSSNTGKNTNNNRIYRKPHQLNNRALTPNNKNILNDTSNLSSISILTEVNMNNKKIGRHNSCYAVIGMNRNTPLYSFEEKLLNKYHQILDEYNSHKTQEQCEKKTKMKYNEQLHKQRGNLIKQKQIIA